MKKLFLLSIMGSICLSASAQLKRSSVIFTGNKTEEAGRNLSKGSASHLNRTRGGAASGYANKTTTVATDRWYNYGEYLTAKMQDEGNDVGLSGVIIWNDTLGRVNYTSGVANNNMVSVGNVFHPQADGFNDVSFYNGELMLTPTDAFTVDSVVLYGIHNYSAAKTGVVDTLILTAVHGSTDVPGDYYFTGMSDYGTDTLFFKSLNYDSVKNTATGAAAMTFKVPITSAMWGDTNSNGIFVLPLALPSAISAAANDKLGMSITFKSGDASFPTTLPGGLIENFDGNYTYNSFYPLAAFKEVGTSTAFSPYYHPPTTSRIDYNEGVYKTLPSYENGWADIYVPQWAWTSSGGASYLQHIYMDWHVKCPTCTHVVSVKETVKNVSALNAVPNPASSEVKVSFSLANAADAVVTLTNTLGQVVASQTVKANAAGVATFNTANLASGVYFYSVVANGEQATGRIAVAH